MKISKRTIAIISTVSLLSLLLIGCGDEPTPGSEDTGTTESIPVEEPQEEEVDIEEQDIKEEPDEKEVIEYGPGMYKVGVDIPEGEYKIFEGDTMDTPIFTVSSDSSGSDSSIISLEIINNFHYLTILEDQYLDISNAYAIPIDHAKPYDGEYKNGHYKVGYDIPAGEYNVIKDESWTGGTHLVEVSSDSSGLDSSILIIDIVESNKYITVEDGQYLDLQGCYIE